MRYRSFIDRETLSEGRFATHAMFAGVELWRSCVTPTGGQSLRPAHPAVGTSKGGLLFFSYRFRTLPIPNTVFRYRGALLARSSATPRLFFPRRHMIKGGDSGRSGDDLIGLPVQYSPLWCRAEKREKPMISARVTVTWRFSRCNLC